MIAKRGGSLVFVDGWGRAVVGVYDAKGGLSIVLLYCDSPHIYQSSSFLGSSLSFSVVVVVPVALPNRDGTKINSPIFLSLESMCTPSVTFLSLFGKCEMSIAWLMCNMLMDGWWFVFGAKGPQVIHPSLALPCAVYLIACKRYGLPPKSNSLAKPLWWLWSHGGDGGAGKALVSADHSSSAIYS